MFKPTPEQAPFWSEALDLVAAWPSAQFRGVFWHGKPGTGKTHCAHELARALRPHRKFAGKAADLVDEVHATFAGDRDARTRFAMRRQIEAADVVLLDDLGRERDGFGQDVMFQLLDAALASDAFVIVTANRSAKELAEAYNGDDGLRSRLSLLMQREWVEMPHLRKGGGPPRPTIHGGEAVEHGPPVTAEKAAEIRRRHGFDLRRLDEIGSVEWIEEQENSNGRDEGTAPTQAG